MNAGAQRAAGGARHPILSSVEITGVLLSRAQVPLEFAVGTLRLSVGRHTTEADVDRAAELIIREANAQRAAAAAAQS